jgi:hypothetical protein
LDENGGMNMGDTTTRIILERWLPPIPHGRLIDADVLKKRINHMYMEAYMDGACYGIHPSLEQLDLLNEIIDDAPTILEAEDGKV